MPVILAPLGSVQQLEAAIQYSWQTQHWSHEHKALYAFWACIDPCVDTVELIWSPTATVWHASVNFGNYFVPSQMLWSFTEQKWKLAWASVLNSRAIYLCYLLLTGVLITCCHELCTKETLNSKIHLHSIPLFCVLHTHEIMCLCLLCLFLVVVCLYVCKHAVY